MHISDPNKDALDRNWNLLFLLEDKSAVNITNPVQPKEDKETGEESKGTNSTPSAAAIGNIIIKPNVINTVHGRILFFSCN